LYSKCIDCRIKSLDGERNKLVVFSIAAHLKYDLIRGMVIGGTDLIRGGTLSYFPLQNIFRKLQDTVKKVKN
jgi:hypothetical protein